MLTERTDFYVYGLAHRDHGLFYIGKGCGSRVHAHELDSVEESGPDSERSRILRQIAAKGESPVRYLIASDLTGQEAYRTGGVLIEFCAEMARSGLHPNLANKARGHGASQLMLRDHQIDLRNAEPADFQGKRILLLSINREFDPWLDYENGVPDHVAGRWTVSVIRAQSCEYIAACTHARIIGVYRASRWEDASFPGDKKPRYRFIGEPALDDFAKSIRYRPLPANVKFGSGMPIAYSR